MCGSSQRSEEDIRSSGTGVTGSYEQGIELLSSGRAARLLTTVHPHLNFLSIPSLLS